MIFFDPLPAIKIFSLFFQNPLPLCHSQKRWIMVNYATNQKKIRRLSHNIKGSNKDYSLGLYAHSPLHIDTHVLAVHVDKL